MTIAATASQAVLGSGRYRIDEASFVFLLTTLATINSCKWMLTLKEWNNLVGDEGDPRPPILPSTRMTMRTNGVAAGDEEGYANS